MELMKERFAKLLLGEDMSGGGKGVSSALALSNAVTNLAGDFFSFNCFLYLPIKRPSLTFLAIFVSLFLLISLILIYSYTMQHLFLENKRN